MGRMKMRMNFKVWLTALFLVGCSPTSVEVKPLDDNVWFMNLREAGRQFGNNSPALYIKSKLMLLAAYEADRRGCGKFTPISSSYEHDLKRYSAREAYAFKCTPTGKDTYEIILTGENRFGDLRHLVE